MAWADPNARDGAGHTAEEFANVNELSDVVAVFADLTVRFWNASIRAFNAYSSGAHDIALNIWGEAIVYIDKGELSISPEDRARLHYNRARALCHLKRRTSALAELQRALTLKADYTNALALQAESMFDLLDFSGCINVLNRLISAHPNVRKWDKMLADAQARDSMSHYEVLGISRDAAEADIRKAFRKCSVKWHPDKHQRQEDAKTRANTMFRRINTAHQILSDPVKKLLYDAEYAELHSQTGTATTTSEHDEASEARYEHASSSYTSMHGGVRERNGDASRSESGSQRYHEKRSANLNSQWGAARNTIHRQRNRQRNNPSSSSSSHRDIPKKYNQGRYTRRNYTGKNSRRRHETYDSDDIFSDLDDNDWDQYENNDGSEFEWR